MQGSKKYITIIVACALMAVLMSCGSNDTRTTESVSTTETVTETPTTAANDGRADYWEDSYSFSMMPYFKMGSFNGCTVTGYVQSLSFTGVDQASAESYLKTMKDTEYFTAVDLTSQSDHFNYHVRDTYGIDYYVYYDVRTQELDLSVDTSSVMSGMETGTSQ